MLLSSFILQNDNIFCHLEDDRLVSSHLIISSQAYFSCGKYQHSSAGIRDYSWFESHLFSTGSHACVGRIIARLWILAKLWIACCETVSVLIALPMDMKNLQRLQSVKYILQELWHIPKCCAWAHHVIT